MVVPCPTRRPNISFVCKLNYPSFTWLVISFVVSAVSRHMIAPCLTHWEVVLQLVKYLKAHPRLGILYRINGDLHVEVFSNSGWVGMGSPLGDLV